MQLIEPELDRILCCTVSKFIDEALNDEDVVRRADAAPKAGRDRRWLLAHVLNLNVGNIVREIDRAIDGERAPAAA